MAAKNHEREILVYAHWKGLQIPSMMGILRASHLRGKEIFSFEYAKEWLNSGNAQHIDPDLQLYSGTQYLRDEKSNFGIFLDSSPDRWGRVLMQRREAILARAENRKVNSLLEIDYLLGVYDEHRMGAIRFKEKEDGPFLNDNREFATPPWTTLRDLEYASLQIEKNDNLDNPEYIKWMNMLIAPGSSLGGARPKAGVLDTAHNLWIAKFPSANDNKDVGVWEMVVYDLAKRAGLNITEAMVRKFTSNYHTFITKRFDRTTKGERIHFASAMTLLGYTDGVGFQEGVSYLELAEFIVKHGAMVDRDLEELWRRIVFSICVSNTDDHLRNHGFLLTEKGWILSPAYDMNPIETGTGLKLNISENDNSLDLNLALEVSEYFRLSSEKSTQIIDTVKKSIKNWSVIANQYKIPKAEQEMMSNAFYSE
jgi:HipA-like C-terminal domain./HipA-like N-terminal domain.